MAHLKPKEVDPNLNLDRASILLNRFSREWDKSECRQKILAMVQEKILGSDNVNITSCVCLGLGSLTAINGYKASWYQLVTLISILEMLGKKHTVKDVYIQDPTFNEMDNTFLLTLGYTVLKTPDAFTKMTEHTFFFAPHLEYQHVASTLQIAQPCFYIGSGLEFWVETGPDDPPSNAAKDIFRSFLETHSSQPMPSFDPDQWWRYISICWIPPTGSTVEPLVHQLRWSKYHRTLPPA